MTRGTRIPFYLAWKYLLRSNKWTLGLTIFFMSIAFINMVFISSLFNGIIEGFNQQIIDMSTGHIVLMPQDGLDTIENTDDTLSIIENTNGVVAASAQTIVPGVLRYKESKGSWNISAIDPDNEKRVTKVSERMIDGSYLEPSDPNGIIIGSEIAGISDDGSRSDNPFVLEGVSVGDTVTLDTGFSKTDLVVRGIYYAKFADTDDRAFITQKTYKRIMGANPEATTIIIRINKTGEEQTVIQRLKNEGLKENMYSWKDASTLIESVSSSFVSINVILSGFGVLIAAITIFIIIYIDISNKRKQIGILRAIGIKPYLIRVTYILQTVIYSISGVIFGSLIYFFAIVPYFKVHPFELPIADATLTMSWVEFVGRFETLILVALISGLIPAIHITRIKILDAIWGR